MTTWRVVERKLVWQRKDRIWTRTDRVVATGLLRPEADHLLERGGVDFSAEPEEEDS